MEMECLSKRVYQLVSSGAQKWPAGLVVTSRKGVVTSRKSLISSSKTVIGSRKSAISSRKSVISSRKPVISSRPRQMVLTNWAIEEGQPPISGELVLWLPVGKEWLPAGNQ